VVERVARLLGIDSSELKDRLRYIDLSEEEINLLKRLSKELTQEDLKRILDEFYEHLKGFEKTKKITEKVSLKTLKEKQVRHLREILEAQYDLQYALKRLKVGLVHEREGVDIFLYMSAFAKWFELVANILKSKVPQRDLVPALIALFKALTLDMTLSVDAYYYARILKSTEAKYRTLIDAVKDGVVLIDVNTKRIIDINSTMEDLIGDKSEYLVGKEAHSLFPEELEPIMRQKCQLYLSKGEGISGVVHIENRKTREWIPVEISLGNYTFEGKRYVVMIFRDIREKLSHEEHIRRLNMLYSALSAINSLVTTALSKDYILRQAVSILREKAGFKYAGVYSLNGKEEVIFEKGEFIPTDTSLCIPMETFDGKKYFILVSKFEEEAFTNEEVELLKEIVHDLSFGMKRVSSEERISYLTLHDPLTDLPNRAYFFQRLSEAVSTAKLTGREVGLLIIDIDHFKELNEALGHKAGDKVLKKVAQFIKSVVRGSDFLARVGADEFGIIVNSEDAQNAIYKLIGRIRSLFDTPVEVDGSKIYITLSFGSSIYPADVETAEVLFSNAMASVEKAKDLGGNTLITFSEGVSKATQERIRIRTGLRQALERGEFKLYYQPKIDLKTGEVVGSEALLRWVHTGKVVPPAEFIPILEESELIHRVGEWVIEEALRQSEEWRKQGYPIKIAVNISPVQLRLPTFAENLIAKFADYNCETCNIEIEITESAIMEDVALSIDLISSLKEHGIKTYIDDFGTGHSSLAYLKKLPVQGLKIDREFIKDIPKDKEDVEIVKATILLAKTFGLETVAEGIETEEQKQFLKKLGCDYAQGFYFLPPVPAEKFIDFVRNNPFRPV